MAYRIVFVLPLVLIAMRGSLAARQESPCLEAPLPGWVRETGDAINLAELGAARLMRVLYQRCDAYELIVSRNFRLAGYDRQAADRLYASGGTYRTIPPDAVYNREAIARRGEHPYLLDTYPENCLDLKKRPPVFYMSGRPRLRQVDGQLNIDLFHGTWVDAQGARRPTLFTTLECSGLASSVYVAGGLKLKAKGSSWEQSQFTTDEFEAVGRPGRRDDCLESAQFSGESSIRGGDILYFREGRSSVGHSGILADVGPDPFGVKDVSSIDGCKANAIDPRRFDFNLIMARGDADTAASKLRARDYTVTTIWTPAILELAAEACRARFAPRPGAASRGSMRTRVLRHVGRKNPDCFHPTPPTMTGERCVSECERSRT